MLMTITQYAEKHGKNPDNVRQKVLRGGFKTAQKLGHVWVIDSDEPYSDARVKSGKYRKITEKERREPNVGNS